MLSKQGMLKEGGRGLKRKSEKKRVRTVRQITEI